MTDVRGKRVVAQASERELRRHARSLRDVTHTAHSHAKRCGTNRAARNAQPRHSMQAEPRFIGRSMDMARCAEPKPGSSMAGRALRA
ncbi:hypothetical protein WS73_16515 [Burkholderia savannae]|nr:hypothetical protein WS91_06680 [Burkholderia sp. MSMB1498]KWZ45734.1 hypothetical protein WS73_16515 [Burkholderia savannae]